MNRPTFQEEESQSGWILPHKTLFDDRTEGSDYQEQRLAALEPSTRAVRRKSSDNDSIHSGDSELSDATTYADEEAPRDLETIKRSLATKASVSDGTPWSWVSSLDVDELDVLDDYPQSELKANLGEMIPEVEEGNNESTSSTTMEGLRQLVEELTAENSLLKRQMEERNPGENKRDTNVRVEHTFKTLHRIGTNFFLREPSWSNGGAGEFFLQGHLPIKSLDEYLTRHEDVAFVAFKDYTVGMKIPETTKHKEEDFFPSPQPWKEAVKLTAPVMITAMREFLKQIPDFEDLLPDFDPTKEIPAPYLFWFCSRPHVDAAMGALPSFQKGLIKLFRDWIENTYGDEWDFVDSEFAKGQVSPFSVKYLVRPGDVLVFRNHHVIDAHIATSWTQVVTEDKNIEIMLQGRAKALEGVPAETDKSPENGEQSPSKIMYSWDVYSWKWTFDGAFKKQHDPLILDLSVSTERTSVPIESLDVYPLKFAGEAVQSQLKKRGRTFWKCRNRMLVSYAGQYEDEMSADGERYMVDVGTYFQFRRRKAQIKLSEAYALFEERDSNTSTRQGEMALSILESDEYPDIPDLHCFPRKVVAYNLRRKLWVDLDVDHIRDVSWNSRAFDSLAIDDDAKELIEAVVTKQIESSKATDIIADKGNGLILLLHGGPGTGKTFTAESMAEHAKKPLYRVTCGDIGTNPEQVETYLESVLHLGLIWDCVVLLDEADVFLEERGQSDLQRNALVSVFLRVLEYYQGILILTSNRVGTFDEAFKSRIQLSLSYKKLDSAQRRKIWRNFLQRLKSLKQDDVEFDDLEDHLDDLVKNEMNGRQIRNVITTARQLAQFRNKKLCYAHLRHVMDIAARFDKHIQSIKGMTDEQAARDAGRR